MHRIQSHNIHEISQCSSISIVPDYRLDDQSSIPGRDKGFFF
jgi:hypothetical protein